MQIWRKPLAWLLAVTLTAGWMKIFSPDPHLGFLAAAKQMAARIAAGSVPADKIAETGRLIVNQRLDAAVTAALLRASAQSTQPPELKKLDLWSGQWTTKGKLYDTPHSHVGEITITMTCGWSAYAGYMICDHLINGPAGRRNDLSIFTFNQAAK